VEQDRCPGLQPEVSPEIGIWSCQLCVQLWCSRDLDTALARLLDLEPQSHQRGLRSH